MEKVLRGKFSYLVKNLSPKGNMTDYLYQEKVLNLDEKQTIENQTTRTGQARELLTILLKKPMTKFGTILKALAESDQLHIKKVLLSEKESGHSENQASVDEDEKEEEEEEADDEDQGRQKVVKIEDFNRDRSVQLVTFACKVVKLEIQKKSDILRLKAILADTTSALVCYAQNENCYKDFKRGSYLIIKNAKWTGNVLFINKLTQIIPSCIPVDIPDNVIEEALGTGPPVSITEAKEKPNHTPFALSGRIIKMSVLTKQERHRKILSHRQVTLQDESGVTNMDIWEDLAESVVLGSTILITSCKNRPVAEGPHITTIPNSNIEEVTKPLPVKRRPQSGLLYGISVDVYQACPNQKCYHFKLTDEGHKTTCRSCGRRYERKQDNYLESKLCVMKQDGAIQSLTVFWPQLEQLFDLFDKTVSLSDGKESIEKTFAAIAAEQRRVIYYSCGSVDKFKIKH